MVHDHIRLQSPRGQNVTSLANIVALRRSFQLAICLVLLVAGFAALSCPHPASAQINGVAQDAPAPLWTPTLLTNASFEQGFAGWHAWPGENYAVYSGPGSGGEGGYYAETNTGTAGAGGSIYQDTSTPIASGDSYTASVLLRSPTGAPAQVDFVIWALGGPPAIAGKTSVDVGHAWQRSYTALDVPAAGYSALRFQVYVSTPGVNVDLDGATLQKTGLVNPAYDEGFSGWHALLGENYAVYPGPGPGAEGGHYLETNTGSAGPGGSIYQDVPAVSVPGHTYAASILLRSPSGSPVQVNLVLWGLGQSGSEVGQTTITVGSTNWTRYSTALDATSGKFTDFRVQLYVLTPGVNVDLNGATLTDQALTNASFEEGFNGWNAWPGENYAVYSGPGSGGEDSHFLETNTGTAGPGGSIYQDVHATLVPGYSYAESALLRSRTGAPAAVDLVLWGLGGGPAIVGKTTIMLSSTNWVRYSTELDVTARGYDVLRFQVYVGTPGVNVDIDGTGVQDQAPTPTPTALRQRIVQLVEWMDQYQGVYRETPLDTNCNAFSYFWRRGSAAGCAPGSSSEEWCSDFAEWAWAIAGVNTSGINGWSFSFVDWAKRIWGAWKPGPTNDPQPGDAVIWGDLNSQYGQHVGIVVGSAEGLIDVVSGNSGPVDALGNVVAVWESDWFDPATSSIDGYPILGYAAPDSFTGS